MSTKRSLRDATQYVTPEDLAAHLELRGAAIVDFARKELSRATRSNKSLALIGLVERLGEELVRYARYSPDVAAAALCVRNVFEANLIIRFVCASDSNVMQWLALRAQEEIDVLKSILTLAKPEDATSVRVIERQIQAQEQVLTKWGMQSPERLPRWDRLAKQFDAEQEYRALYGAYSKYVHPSAWTIVKPDRAREPEFTMLFVLNAQVYVHDGAVRAAKALDMNDDGIGGPAWNRNVDLRR